jgi:hypothetical protein
MVIGYSDGSLDYHITMLATNNTSFCLPRATPCGFVKLVCDRCWDKERGYHNGGLSLQI